MRLKLSIGALAITALIISMPSAGADEEIDWLKSIKGPVREPAKHKIGDDNDYELNTASKIDNEYGTLDTLSPQNIKNHAAKHLKQGHYDTAIKLIETSLEKEPCDNDARQIYADALEGKLKSMDKKDPTIFNRCVKQWYYLYKNAEYSEITTSAGNHLRELTGKSPYIWPTARMYFKHVLMPEVNGTDLSVGIASEEPQLVH